MARTILELVDSVLSKHGRKPSGQTADPSNVKTVEDEYDELYQELLDNGLVNWAVRDNIPLNASGIIKKFLLGRTADNFGKIDKWTASEEQVRQLNLQLSRLLASPYVEQPTPFEDF